MYLVGNELCARVDCALRCKRVCEEIAFIPVGGEYATSPWPLFTVFLIKRYVCFSYVLVISFSIVLMALWLSTRIVTGLCAGAKPVSSSSCFTQGQSSTAIAPVMYLTSAVERVTGACFFLHQLTSMPFTVNRPPKIDVAFSRSSASSASEEMTGFSVEEGVLQK